MLRIGLDIGSTTAKIVAIKEDKSIVYHNYKRHNAQMLDVVLSFLNDLEEKFKNEDVTIKVSGSIGMGFAERYSTDVLCLNELAKKSNHIYPIASRCGVFSKTDIQNLISKNICKEDITASIFHAVAVQTISTLAHGIDIETPIMFCEGSLTFLSSLQQAFMEYLSLNEYEIILPQHGELITAIGTALTRFDNEEILSLKELIDVFSKYENIKINNNSKLEAIFKDENDFNFWQERISKNKLRQN